MLFTHPPSYGCHIWEVKYTLLSQNPTPEAASRAGGRVCPRLVARPPVPPVGGTLSRTAVWTPPHTGNDLHATGVLAAQPATPFVRQINRGDFTGEGNSLRFPESVPKMCGWFGIQKCDPLRPGAWRPSLGGSARHKVQGQGSHLISPRPRCPVLYL